MQVVKSCEQASQVILLHNIGIRQRKRHEIKNMNTSAADHLSLSSIASIECVLSTPDLMQVILEFVAGTNLALGPRDTTYAFGGIETSCKEGRWLQLSAAPVCKAFRAASHAVLSRYCKQVALPPGDVLEQKAEVYHPLMASSLLICIERGLTMSCAPPEDDGASLRSLLTSMGLAPKRFSAVKKLHVANHVVDDSALTSLSSMTPSLHMLCLFGSTITEEGLTQLVSSCPQLTHLHFMYCPSLNATNILQSGVNPRVLSNLKKIIWIDEQNSLPEPELLEIYGLAACSSCPSWFPLGSTAETCLVHPGTYSGYGASCSSFNCCGSAKPGYPYTPGCTWVAHTPVPKETNGNTSTTYGQEQLLATTYNRMPIVELIDSPFQKAKEAFGGRRFWLRDTRETRFEQRIGPSK